MITGNSAAAAAVTTDTKSTFQNENWDTESATPETQASSMMPHDKLDHSRSFGFDVSVFKARRTRGETIHHGVTRRTISDQES